MQISVIVKIVGKFFSFFTYKNMHIQIQYIHNYSQNFNNIYKKIWKFQPQTSPFIPNKTTFKTI